MHLSVYRIHSSLDAAILSALCIQYINQEAEHSQNPAGPWHQPGPQLWGITVLTSYSIDEFGLLFEFYVNGVEQYVLFYVWLPPSKFCARVYSCCM